MVIGCPNLNVVSSFPNPRFSMLFFDTNYSIMRKNTSKYGAKGSKVKHVLYFVYEWMRTTFPDKSEKSENGVGVRIRRIKLTTIPVYCLFVN